MRPLPDREANAQLRIVTGLRRVVQAEAVRFSATELNRRTLNVVGGSLTQTLEGTKRWSGNLDVALSPEDAIPSDPSDILTPFGTQITVRLGIEYRDVISTVPYGTYTLMGSSAAISTDSRLVSLDLGDLSERVAGHRYEEPEFFHAGTDVGDMADDVVSERDPTLIPNTALVGNAGAVTHRDRVLGLDTSTNPWDELTEIMAANHRVIWFDRDGFLRVGRPVSNPSVSADIQLPAPSVSIEFSQRPANVVVARSSAPDSIAYGKWENKDPSTPTFVGGAYGRVTRFYASPQLETKEECRLAAETIGTRLINAGAAWTVIASFDPTWDVGDTMLLPPTVTGTDKTGLPVLIRSITIDLSGEVTYTCHSASTAEQDDGEGE